MFLLTSFPVILLPMLVSCHHPTCSCDWCQSYFIAITTLLYYCPISHSHLPLSLFQGCARYLLAVTLDDHLSFRVCTPDIAKCILWKFCPAPKSNLSRNPLPPMAYFLALLLERPLTCSAITREWMFSAATQYIGLLPYFSPILHQESKVVVLI